MEGGSPDSRSVDGDSGNIYPIHIQQNVVLASEPVGGRSRETELPCYIHEACIV